MARSIRLSKGWNERVGSPENGRLAKDRNREFKYYRLTAAGRKRLIVEESKWKRLAAAIAQVMWPVKEG
jgi:DNA-binding PadR family transcriptional regulator